MSDTRKLGLEKEKEALKFLKKNGYKILETNYTTPFGEIDIIAKDKKDIVFIEVKYRQSSYSGTPQEAVNQKKQKKIIKSAILYIKRNDIKDNIRFDIVALSPQKTEIIKAAFSADSLNYYF